MQKYIIFIVSHEKYYTSSIVCQMTIIIIYLEILKNIIFFSIFVPNIFHILKKNKNRLKPASLLCYDINMLLLVFARPLKIPSHTYIIISISVF